MMNATFAEEMMDKWLIRICAPCAHGRVCTHVISLVVWAKDQEKCQQGFAKANYQQVSVEELANNIEI